MKLSRDPDTLPQEELIECDCCGEEAAVKFQGKVICQNCHVIVDD